jgi:hypothetical protein
MPPLVECQSSQTCEPVGVRRIRDSHALGGALIYSIAIQPFVAGPAGLALDEDLILFFMIEKCVFIVIPRLGVAFVLWGDECQLRR